MTDAAALDAELGLLAGVVAVGLFARRVVVLLLVAGDVGVVTLKR
jgi:ribose 5-phosphate isomerase